MNALRLLHVFVLLGATASMPPALAQTYLGTFSGANEAPPNASPGTGSVVLVLDGTQLGIHATFAGLTGVTTAAHIHCCTMPGTNAGVATQTPSFATFPVGVSAGEHVQVLDLELASSFNATFIANNTSSVEGARAALIAGLDSGAAYYNIHTTVVPGGEIRANLVREDLFADGFEGD